MKTSPSRLTSIVILITVFILLAFTPFSAVTVKGQATPPELFDGKKALALVETQLEFGPRIPGSNAHELTGNWILRSLQELGWQTKEQHQVVSEEPLRNLSARRGEGASWIILGAHYDTRQFADHDADPQKQQEAVPGANDGASGVAVLLELARVLPKDISGQVWLAFFDREDQGGLSGQPWIVGSTVFAGELQVKPDAVVVVDMVGDASQQIYIETNSDRSLVDEIWAAADGAGYADRFISSPKHTMIDDHTPFLKAGMAAADIIDFDYAWWHTTGDTLDKISAESLEAVGRTLQTWLGKRGLISAGE